MSPAILRLTIAPTLNPTPVPLACGCTALSLNKKAAKCEPGLAFAGTATVNGTVLEPPAGKSNEATDDVIHDDSSKPVFSPGCAKIGPPSLSRPFISCTSTYRVLGASEMLVTVTLYSCVCPGTTLSSTTAGLIWRPAVGTWAYTSGAGRRRKRGLRITESARPLKWLVISCR